MRKQAQDIIRKERILAGLEKEANTTYLLIKNKARR